MARLLAVERHQEERAEDLKVDEQADGVDAKECRVVQQCARQQLLSRAPLMTREGGDRQYGNDCRREDARANPSRRSAPGSETRPARRAQGCRTDVLPDKAPGGGAATARWRVSHMANTPSGKFSQKMARHPTR
jgi:hypothetical protein